jgi:hypothetical protein
MKNPNGYVIYEGASQINGEPIVAVVTLKSNNIKTGNMASMWIMHQNIKPNEASKTGDDESVCGMCPHRHFLGGACYVTLFQAPLQVFKSYKNGNYPKIDDISVFKGMPVRFGAYGDPFALPIDILAQIKAVASNNTSYTHQWRENEEGLKKVSMASVDSIDEAKQAHEMGWRTFRVTNDITNLMDNEMVCPNTTHNVLIVTYARVQVRQLKALLLKCMELRKRNLRNKC